MNGNCKHVLNMSQSDHVELWHSVMNGGLEAYLRVSSKLKLVAVEDKYSIEMNLSSKFQQSTRETDMTGQAMSGRIPVQLYVLTVREDFDGLEDASNVDSWDKVSFINRPVEIQVTEESSYSYDAYIHQPQANASPYMMLLKLFCQNFFYDKPLICDESPKVEGEDKMEISSEDVSNNEGGENLQEHVESCYTTRTVEIKLVRIQGIEAKLEIPFSWVVNNLMNPDHFLHICICVKVPEVNTT